MQSTKTQSRAELKTLSPGGITSANTTSSSGQRADSTLCHLRADEPGPSLVVLGALHGNETSGAHALERVLAVLSEQGPSCGEVVALIGNPEAFAQGRRFVDRDLNRSWDPARLAHLRAETEPASSVEDNQMLKLARDFDAVRQDARGPCYLLDLHSTSGDSIPFLNVVDTLPGRWLARSIPVPVVLGLDETLPGTLLQYIEGQSYIGLVFEAGRHDDPRSIDHAEAAIWITLQNLNLLPRVLHTKAAWGRGLLAEASQGEHRMFDVVYRHHLDADAQYKMAPGFSSFQPVRFGDLLANEDGNDVLAPMSGTMLMPLYQTQGDDGFFLMNAWGETIQGLSRVARRLHLDSWLPVLPGVRRPPGEKRQLWVSDAWRSGARQFVLRLLGYRTEVRREPGHTLMKRRRQGPPTA